jgi:hypothetical protein
MPGYNNWFETSIPNSSVEPFKIKLNPESFIKKSFYDTSLDTIKLILNKYNNVYLGYSGGFDSEFILQLCYENNLPVTPIIAITPYNMVEKDYALHFCRKRGIEPKMLTIDEKMCIELMYYKIYKSENFYNYFSFITLTLADFAKENSGYLLTGFGDPFGFPEPYPDPMSTTLEVSDFDYYLDYYDPIHPNCFFSYNTAIFYSLISEIDYSLPEQEAKSKLYNLPFRPKIDYSKSDVHKIFTSMPKKFRSFSEKHLINSKSLIIELEKFIVQRENQSQ